MRVSKKEGKKPGIIRPFGNVECYEFHMLQLRFLGSTVVNSRYTIPTSLAAAELHDRVVARVEDALARVVLEHPALRLDVVGADTKRPAWVAVDEIDFGHHVSWEDVGGDDGAGVEYDEILRDRIERLLDEPYTRLAGRPHWRVLVLFSGPAASFLDIVFDYSHAFSDGTSGKIFHETLLRQLDASPTTETETETKQDAVLANRVLRIPPTARSLPRPIEDIAEFRVSARFALATAWKELLPARLASASAAHANWAPIRAAPYKTRLRTFDLDRWGFKLPF